MASRMKSFQAARWCVLISLLLLVLTAGFVLVNRSIELVPHTLLWWTALSGTALAVFGLFGYRCPNCRMFPEAGDVAMFNPTRCDHCGTTLK
jgi:hypothetical protein